MKLHPLFWFGLGAENTKCETPLNASEYKYMKIRYNSAAEDDVLRLFYATYTDLNNNPGPAFTAENMIDLDIKHGAGWAVVDFRYEYSCKLERLHKRAEI